MKGFLFCVEGNWAHFKKPETNNNPLTHDFITKSALVGLIGAVIGKERQEMRHLFPQLCEDLFYGVQIVNAIKKESWGFTLRKAVNLFEKAPKQMEFLKQPKFRVALALANEASSQHYFTFLRAIKNNEACFDPVLGLHNCSAQLAFESEGEFSEKRYGDFSAKCFVSRKHRLNLSETRQFRIGLDRVPTFQNDDFWNPPDRYIEVIYPAENNSISVEGDYYEYDNGERWWLT